MKKSLPLPKSQKFKGARREKIPRQDQRDQQCISAVLNYLDLCGIYATESNDLHGPDVAIYKGYVVDRYIACEVRRNWTRGNFPFKTIVVYGNLVNLCLHSIKPVDIYYLRADLKQAIVIQDQVIGSGKYRIGEDRDQTIEVPIEECESIDLEI